MPKFKVTVIQRKTKDVICSTALMAESAEDAGLEALSDWKQAKWLNWDYEESREDVSVPVIHVERID